MMSCWRASLLYLARDGTSKHSRQSVRTVIAAGRVWSVHSLAPAGHKYSESPDMDSCFPRNL